MLGMTIRRNMVLLLRCTNEIPFALRCRVATYQRKRVTTGIGLWLTSHGHEAPWAVLLLVHCCFCLRVHDRHYTRTAAAAAAVLDSFVEKHVW